MMKIKQVALIFGFLMIATLYFSVSVGAAQAQRPPPTPSPPKPASKIVLLDVERMVSPALLKPGEAMTYTVRVTNQGDLEGTKIVLELPLVGNQEYSGWAAGGSGFSLESTEGGKLLFSRPAMTPNTDVNFKVFATVPSDTTRNYLQQAITATWQDVNDYRTATFNIRAAIDVPATTPTPTIPPVNPRPPDPDLPTDGPFAAQPAPDSPNTPTRWYLQATKHYLSNGFLAYWLQNGSVLNFGYPISEEFSENGMTVQYFQRAVFEYHPENPEAYVILTRSLGRELDKAEPPASSSPSDGSIYFAETGHWLDSRFVETWQKRGGVLAMGFPIATPKVEGNKLVQWFERTRLELDISKPNALIEIAQVGREYAVSRGYLK
jgi:Domain of unknown function DUF11